MYSTYFRINYMKVYVSIGKGHEEDNERPSHTGRQTFGDNCKKKVSI